MKLFLSSVVITPDLLPHFVKLVGKDPADIRLCLIENAADTYPEESRGFIQQGRDSLEAAGLKLNFLNLKDYFGKPHLEDTLQGYDVIWFGGGNTYYLRWALRESGFEAIARQLANQGIVLAGGSAGALVMGPTLKHFESADDPDKAPELINKGLGLIDFVPIPHWHNEKFGHIMTQVKAKLDQASIKSIAMTDDQGIVVDGSDVKLVP